MFLMAGLMLSNGVGNQIPKDTEASTINDSLFSAIKTMKIYLNE